MIKRKGYLYRAVKVNGDGEVDIRYFSNKVDAKQFSNMCEKVSDVYYCLSEIDFKEKAFLCVYVDDQLYKVEPNSLNSMETTTPYNDSEDDEQISDKDVDSDMLRTFLEVE